MSTLWHIQTRYLPLIKGRQTLMLALTGLAGYLSQQSPESSWGVFIGLTGSLLLTISGFTILNMLIDRDLDYRMERTRNRPLATRQVSVRAAAILALVLLIMGLGWSYTLSRLYFLLAIAGGTIDVVIYTLWLKRRTAWAILWGGIAGGIPILAGRVLARGEFDAAGLLLAMAIICWIPSHNITLGMMHSKDYLHAGIPTFANAYGTNAARSAVVLSSLLTTLMFGSAFLHLGFLPTSLSMLAIISLGWIGVIIHSLLKPSHLAFAKLYHISSLYMLLVMLITYLSTLLFRS